MFKRASCSEKNHTFFVSIFLFFFFLAYFIFSTGWYEPSKLVLQARATQGSPLLLVRWNSGEGLNKYEQRMFRPESVNNQFDKQFDKQHKNRITFGATGEQCSASLSSEVVCTALIIDGIPFDFDRLTKDSPITYTNGELYFNHRQQVSLTVQAESHISFRFRTNNHSGIASIAVNGRAVEQDLYIANVEAKFKQFDYWLLGTDGSFTIKTALPRYPVHELEILSGHADKPIQLIRAEIHGKEKVIDLLKEQQPVLGKINFTNVLHEMQSFFHPVQFCWQVLFALLSVWICVALARTVHNAGGLMSCLLAEKRYIFWIMFSTSLAVLGTWLAAFWPGVMSVDSLKVWRAAMLPDIFMNDHPFMNVLLYKYLYQIWNNPAVVPITQVILTALLISWFGFWLYRQGVYNIIVACWFLFLLCSVPVAVYNLMLWKDIPFALLIVLWACLLTKLYQERRQGRLQWSKQRFFALVLLGLALVLIRHNGLVYIFTLPLLFLFLGLVPMKKVLIGLLGPMTFLLAGGIMVAAFTALHLSGKTRGMDFFTQKISSYTKQLSVKDIASDAERTLRNYMTVLNINQTAQKWDKFHYYFHDRYAWSFLLHAGWWDLYPYQQEVVAFPKLRKTAMRIYEKSYQEPWVWLSWNPVWLLGLLPVFTLLFWWFPNTAILGVMLLAGSLPLVYLRIFNWRYYYFLYLGLLFVPAFVGLDIGCRKRAARLKG